MKNGLIDREKGGLEALYRIGLVPFTMSIIVTNVIFVTIDIPQVRCQ